MNSVSLVSVITGVLVALATAVSSNVQAFWGHHASASAIVIGIYAAVAHFLPSPTMPTPSK
jgi:hypothetical protein